MSTDHPDTPDIEAASIETARIEDEMEQSYIDYAMSVIAGRALPDVRDGLKPVHRRILYAMDEAGVSSGSAHRKSSSIVGETMGDFHPHGDSAIYDTLARMAQDFSMRYPLVDGQGNFGSVDGDPPAAMRYTEARMAPMAEELLADIEKDTVDFTANYDDRLEEPSVLPAAFPNLLVNGSSGIAVGMSTNIPPHNLGEVIDATVHLIENPDCRIEDLMGHIKGPDFPTGANIVGRGGVHSAYKTGRGRLRVRAEFSVDEEAGRIVITELPFQENKSRLVERIADDVNSGKLEGIRDLRDESDRDGIRVVIELKRDAMAEVVKNQLLESHLERTFGVINLALVDGSPQVLTLKETLEHYLEHRREVVRRRSQFELDAAEDRAHILEGRLTALEHVDEVVELIQDAADRDAAKAALRTAFAFSEAQVEHIVSMQLGSLTAMEASAIEDEYADVQAHIERLTEILTDESELLGVIESELLELKAEYDDDRRTSFIEDNGTVAHEDLIPEEDVVVVMSEDDYIKRMPLSTFRAQNRGGKGIIGTDLKEGDRVSSVFVANSHDYLLCFTTHGQIYELRGFQIPEMSRTARGKSAVNLLDLDDGEDITAVVNIEDLANDDVGSDVDSEDADIDSEDVAAGSENADIDTEGVDSVSDGFDRSADGVDVDRAEVDSDTDENTEGTERYLTMVTREGYIKRTAVSAFQNIRTTGIRALRLEDGDELVDVEVTDGDRTLVIATAEGMAIRFDERDVRPMGRSARGVRGIDLQGEDVVAGVAAVDTDRHNWVLTVTEHGYGKRSDIEAYRVQSRNGKGLIDIKTNDRNGPVCAMETVGYGDHLVVMSSEGQIMRTPVEGISTVGRNTMGVTVMALEATDSVACLDVIPREMVTAESESDVDLETTDADPSAEADAADDDAPLDVDADASDTPAETDDIDPADP